MRRREEHPDPCDHTELPKVIARKSRTLTPEEFEQLVAAVPAQYWLMLDTFIETGMRWGELIALRPRHIDFLRRTVSVEETIVETSKVNSPTGERFIVKPYPKNNEPRTFGVRQAWLDAVAKHVSIVGLGRDDLIFTTKVGTRSPATASAPTSGFRPSRPAVSISPYASTTCATEYLHALPDADQKNLDALERVTRRA